MGHEETFLGNGNVLCCDYGSGYMAVFICQNLIVYLKLVYFIEHKLCLKN